MASDLLNVGTQSVLTAQRQLNTTGHNISNANTEGYSRQSVIQGTNSPRMYGGETFGMGVHVENVRRSWDQFAVNELNVSTTSKALREDDESNINQLTSMLSSLASKKIPENINEWFDSIKTLADSPNDMGARKVVLEKAGLISQNLNTFYETVRQQSSNTNRKLDLAINRVNQIGDEIKDLHKLMMRTPGPHNDLMDSHEKLVKELSEYTKVTVTPRNNNEGYNIHIGSGHTLVSGAESSKLAIVDGSPDAQQRQLALVEGKGIKPINHTDIDGKLESLFKMRDELIPYVQDELGRVATSISYGVNELQSQGLDLRGAIGASVFTDVNSDSIAKSRVVLEKNSQADLAVYIDDISQIKAGDYQLRYDGSDYTVLKPSGDVVQVEPKNSALYIDGMRVEMNESPRSGEKIILRPVRFGAEQIKVAMNDPAKIAAQSYASSATFEQGDAEFRVIEAGDLKEFQVVVSPQGDQFAVLDMNGKVLLQPQDYPPTGSVTVQGTTFELTEGAVANDKFAANLTASEGDNGNLRKMQDLQTAKNLNDNNSTILQLYHDLNTDMGLKMSTASRLSEVARLENESAQERVAEISGVNLDEEAANMMKFQQSYMASSRIMQVANDTFNTILALR
ncbi:flagellar hook-associated protein FlgK [Vibrio sp. TH_r3]|uniref:flagellar hook-associated protein FlgK n=1 Tax=Vibrio sp. TH_r3 TaxID=3082084 RepID=UPI002953C07B|nr:flagellar hook-associated protein FlgK [Vibrio sp. TH_r3]MDV7103236.1 flagellar hook-associated protein FlgK [Vibrio sp. TH_r3]